MNEILYKPLYLRPKSLARVPTHYCPGCHHGIVHRLLAEVIDELGIQEKTVIMAPVGCSVLIYNYFEVDSVECAHGRAPAVATGIKRARPDSVVITYQGDGDLAAIGTAEIVHAATRGERITTIFINNTNFGMTGGQMAPTTLIGQKTETTPYGRSPERNGYPIRVAEMLATLNGPAYIARVAVYNPTQVMRARNSIKKAIQVQIEGKGFGFVEVLSTCPTNWGLKPTEAIKWLEENMIPVYPLGEFVGGSK
ncbi:MAG: thiamine pyrophosphate-dependent enzyme [bacterium]|nr:thiamine pyrophosphate-dependent enzyme [Caldisericota bacterium]